MSSPDPVRRFAAFRRLLLPLLVLAGLGGCTDHPTDVDTDDPAAANPDWTTASHGDAAPDYALVFPQDSVNVLRITMTAAHWAAIRQNMVALWGFDFGQPGMPGSMPLVDPQYVAVRVDFNGRHWDSVGFRLKGNSSLSAAWRQGNYKLPFRLNFDEHEDRYRAVHDQRFHGFDELSMSAGFHDPSLLHEKVAADIFRRAGIPAARTAHYRVFVDFGAGSKYCGVYTMVEVIEDTMVKDQFGEESGNIYKPTSQLRDFLPAQFEKKNHQELANYADVQAFVGALNSMLRTSNPAAWRAGLEATFDVEHFLKYLAVNNAIVNWDSYGRMAQNYYLYNRPGRGLTWIPWDHNEALTGDPGIIGSGSPGQKGLSLSMNEVTAIWPLIRNLAADSVYYARYRAHLGAFYDEVFTESAMNALFEKYHRMIAPYVVGPDGEQPRYTFLPSPDSFNVALGVLWSHVRSRRALIATFLQRTP